MPLVAVSIRLDRIEESLLFEASDGSFWLSCVCSYEQDAKGRMVVAQSIPRERYAAGEKGPAVGNWREIGKPNPGQPGSPGKPAFDLSKYKKPQAPDQARSTAGGEPVSNGSLFPDEEGGAQ